MKLQPVYFVRINLKRASLIDGLLNLNSESEDRLLLLLKEFDPFIIKRYVDLKIGVNPVLTVTRFLEAEKNNSCLNFFFYKLRLI